MFHELVMNINSTPDARLQEFDASFVFGEHLNCLQTQTLVDCNSFPCSLAEAAIHVALFLDPWVVLMSPASVAWSFPSLTSASLSLSCTETCRQLCVLWSENIDPARSTTRTTVLTNRLRIQTTVCTSYVSEYLVDEWVP